MQSKGLQIRGVLLHKTERFVFDCMDYRTKNSIKFPIKFDQKNVWCCCLVFLAPGKSFGTGLRVMASSI